MLPDPDPMLDEPQTEIPVRVAPVLMMPSRDILLFASAPPPSRGSASFVGSILIHALAAAVLWFSLGYKPPVTRIVHEHYTVRQVDLHMPPPQAAGRIPYPKLHRAKAAAASHAQAAPPAARPVTQARLDKQTLIQPDIPKFVTLPQPIPVPQVVLWAPSKTPVKNIVPPTPEQPTAADVTPSFERPNQELNLSDVNIASSNLPSIKLQLAPSTTSPVSTHNPSPVQLPPASASQPTAQPTPAAVLSLSDIRLEDGTAVLPPVNESQASDAQGALTTGHAQNSSAQNGNGAPDSKSNGASQNPDVAANQPDSSPATANPGAASDNSGPGASADAAPQHSSTPLALPKDGHFGAVVVGDALEQAFPELAGAWSGRVAYTAYLHVGLAKSWIMQYSLPRDVEAAAGGTVSRLEAPWPYNIVRPNLAPDSIDADALMIRGFVNQSGRFEELSIAFPQSFSGAQFVITALQQWQFRPATQDGQPVKVEVMIIIPEVLE